MTQHVSESITWEIQNFANLTDTKAISYLRTKQEKFSLRFYPNDLLKNMNQHISIYLLREIPHTSDVKVLWSIWLINNKGEECYRKAIETNYNLKSGNYPIEGGLYYLYRDSILEPSSGLLPGGKLTVKCTVTILDGQDFSKLSIDKQNITLAKYKALENYQLLLGSSKFSDVVFVIGKKEFKLHKNILASQSPVFAAMFDSDLEETKQNRVDITDVEADVFEAMVRFIYSANVDSVQQYALDLFVAADKYQLDSLKDICADSLVSNLSIDSVANILIVADMHSAHELKSKCVQYINNSNATKVFATDGWKQLVKCRMELGLELYYDIVSKFEKK